MPVIEEKGNVLSPQEVRNILKTHNREIIQLCKKASIVPKKDKKGQTQTGFLAYNNGTVPMVQSGASSLATKPSGCSDVALT